MKLDNMNLGTIPLSPDILKKGNIGLWAFELDEGKAPRMYVDDAMLGLIGLDHQVSPEETYHAWYDNIDKGSYDLVADAVEKMTAGQHAEVQYPWHHPDGRTMTVRCGGVRNREYRAGIRIEGTHQDVTRIIHFDEEVEERRRNDLSLSLISALSESYSTLYYIEPDSGNYQMITRNHDYFNKVHSKMVTGSTFYIDTARNLEKVIYPEDRDLLLPLTSMEGMENGLNGNDSFSIDYRLIIDGQPCWYKVKVVKIIGTGDTFHYAVGVMDNSVERKKEEEQRRDMEIISILASEYTSVYYINLTTDELTPYTMNDDTESVFGDIFRSGIKFSKAFRLYVLQNILDNDRKMMLKAGSTGNIMAELKDRKTFITTYRNTDGHYCEMKFVKVGNEQGFPSAVALGFADKDSELRELFKRQQDEERNTAVITSLSDDFTCVAYVNFDTDEEILYRIDPLFERNVPGWSTVNNFTSRLKAMVESVMHPDDRDAFWKATRPGIVRLNIEQSGTYYVNFRTLIAGETTYYQLKFSRDEHSAGHVTAGFRNVDLETKRELEALNRAEAANRAKTAFLFNMSHDIRTPMNAIIGFTDMAMNNIGNREKAVDCLEKVKHASDMLLSLINDILDMSRIESGKVRLHEVSVSLDDVFGSLSEVMSQSAAAKGLKLTFQASDIQDMNVLMDQPRVNRILVNLISNAIKYTPSGGTVKVFIRQLQGACEGCGLYRFEITDNGIGMSEEFQKHMFEEFSREETSTVSGIQGTGLGLPLSLKLTTLMGGTITCRSRQGQGTSFFVTIPFRLSSGQETVSKSDEDTATQISLVGLKALLVEDNELNREIATSILESAGLAVDTAVNGETAIETLRISGPDHYDFILMDIQMPVMDGYQATQIIRNEMPELKAPIIAISANAFEEDRAKSRTAGMDDHIAKPIDVQELLHILKKHRR